MNLNQKIAIVTGGASGFGAATAQQMAAAGACVMVADLNAEGAQAIADRHVQNAEQAALGVFEKISHPSH